MSTLTPLDTLYETAQGTALPLPPELAALYGQFHLKSHPNRPHVIGNFVTTLDGVVSLNVPDQAGGKEISGFNQHDRMVMGLLRAAADAVIVGAGTLRAAPSHLWTAEYIYPPLAESYRRLRADLDKPETPLNVIVTAGGQVDTELRVFSGKVPVLIVTTDIGTRWLSQHHLPPTVQVASVSD
jgi:riboflavin biosynthesis pyrimidine reductase